MKLQSTDVFLWILWNLQEHFLQTVSDGCFWKFEKCLCSTIFSQQLKLCLHLIYFYSCSFAPSMAKMSSSIFFSNVSLNDTSCRKKCIMRKLSWNSEKPSSHPDVLMVKDAFLKISQNSSVRVLFFAKGADWTTATLLKRDSSTWDFLWILWNSQEHLFYRKPPDYCFWKWPRRAYWNLSFLTRHRLYLNSSYIFAKNSAKSHCFTLSDSYLVYF